MIGSRLSGLVSAAPRPHLFQRAANTALAAVAATALCYVPATLASTAPENEPKVSAEKPVTIHVGDVVVRVPADAVAIFGVRRPYEPGATYTTDFLTLDLLPVEGLVLPELPEWYRQDSVLTAGTLSISYHQTGQTPDNNQFLDRALRDGWAEPVPGAESADANSPNGTLYALGDHPGNAVGYATARQIILNEADGKEIENGRGGNDSPTSSALTAVTITCNERRPSLASQPDTDRRCNVWIALSERVDLNYTFYDYVWPDEHHGALARLIGALVNEHIEQGN